MTPFKEAKSRAGMVSMNVWLPAKLHKELALARVRDGIAANEAIREAVVLWLAHRKAERKQERRNG
jgi:Arc/MetJ-type ribon-helix-helix transcriptional regulator